MRGKPRVASLFSSRSIVLKVSKGEGTEMSVVCKVVIDDEAPKMFCFALVPRFGDHIAFNNSIAQFDALRVERVVHFARDFKDEKAPGVLLYCYTSDAKK